MSRPISAKRAGRFPGVPCKGKGRIMNATEDKTYNGWTNYETWVVNLWIGNEEGDYRYWQAAAQECYDEAGEGVSAYAKFTGREIFTREERAVLALEKQLKSEIEENAPDLGASMFADLLNAAMSEVNWHEIAAGMIDGVDKSEPEADEEDSEEEE